jgi:hypothetical protein
MRLYVLVSLNFDKVIKRVKLIKNSIFIICIKGVIVNHVSIRHVLSLANYDFKQHFFSWFSLLSFQTILLFVITLLNIFLGYQFSQYDNALFIIDLVVMGIVLMFPVIILQNSLDLAFDSAMRGMTLRGNIIQYFVIKILQAVVLSVCCVPLLLLGMVILFGYEAVMSVDFLLYFAGSLDTIIFTAIGLLTSLTTLPIVLVAIGLGLYIFIRLQFAALDTLEYKSSIVQSFKNSVIITRHRFVMLLPIVFLQLGSLFCVKFAISFVISYLPTIVYDFAYAELVIDSFVFVLEGFMLVWGSLLAAHTYRQLICPPSENQSCSSCTTC